MITRSLAALLGLFTALPVAHPARQSESSQPQTNTPALTLHAESRIVLADVSVTDRHGNPVHGLTAQDFQVFDNNQPQRIASFEEHNATTESTTFTAPPPTSTRSNNYQHFPPVLNALVIDTTNLELPDQMYLRLQLLKFLGNLPPTQPLAVFERHGDFAVLLQPFTADRALLEAAVNRALPRFILNGRGYRTDTQTLQQIAVYLSQVPGRKNILWFSGGSTAYLLEGLSALTVSMPQGPPPTSAAAAAEAAATAPSMPLTAPAEGESPDALRQVFDELEAARIAVYPIDARGLTTEGDIALGPQQSQMAQTAEATGGEAFFNRNGLAQIAAHILSTDSSSYTLTWSPRNFHADSKWHTIRIVCRNHDYHLSYRRGYFADKPHAPATKFSKHSTLFAGGATPALAPDLRNPPLRFEATVQPARSAATDANFVALRPPAPPAKGTSAFHIDYALSTAGLSSATVDGSSRATLFFAAIALDANGERIGQAIDRVRFPLDPSAPARKLQVAQQIDLPRGSNFLALAVWDPVSGHMGTLQIPVTVASPQTR
ncbi:MAG TPA: VWA domain-containing protein [Candidatus Aquilonibacter sp.]|nr:VWA domain-containing protein [Candidatus Aquilonibacter sp.]